ncbi:MAG TPA: hypothetical protein V6C57_07505, partial [Coleofasciculaceae cyanobacterium]
MQPSGKFNGIDKGMTRSVTQWVTSTAAVVSFLVWPAGALAQVTPDQTLGTERSRVVSGRLGGRPAQQIQGGAQRGQTL